MTKPSSAWQLVLDLCTLSVAVSRINMLYNGLFQQKYDRLLVFSITIKFLSYLFAWCHIALTSLDVVRILMKTNYLHQNINLKNLSELCKYFVHRQNYNSRPFVI